MQFNALLLKELHLRNLRTTGSIIDKRERLYERMKLELDLHILEFKYQHNIRNENSYYC